MRWITNQVRPEQLGYIIACIMGFTSMYYGFAAEGDDSGKPHYNSDKAETVSVLVLQLILPWEAERYEADHLLD